VPSAQRPGQPRRTFPRRLAAVLHRPDGRRYADGDSAARDRTDTFGKPRRAAPRHAPPRLTLAGTPSAQTGRGTGRPTPVVSASAGTVRGRKTLPCQPHYATFTANGRPLGECRSG
jgi:hypothetical protein